MAPGRVERAEHQAVEWSNSAGPEAGCLQRVGRLVLAQIWGLFEVICLFSHYVKTCQNHNLGMLDVLT